MTRRTSQPSHLSCTTIPCTEIQAKESSWASQVLTNIGIKHCRTSSKVQ